VAFSAPLQLASPIDTIVKPQFNNRGGKKPATKPKVYGLLDGSWAYCENHYRGGHAFYIIQGKGWGGSFDNLRVKIHYNSGGWDWGFIPLLDNGGWQLTFKTTILTEPRIEHSIKKLFGYDIECF
jgi:hypothetical protein